MRLWSLHPKYLDPAGLVALWREGLLAQAVLRGDTKGYRHHPQLERFRSGGLGAIAAYLREVHAEAGRRGYSFDAGKISRAKFDGTLTVSRGQLEYEWRHLKNKLERRSPDCYRRIVATSHPNAHPLFRVVAGGVAAWERAESAQAAADDLMTQRAVQSSSPQPDPAIGGAACSVRPISSDALDPLLSAFAHAPYRKTARQFERYLNEHLAGERVTLVAWRGVAAVGYVNLLWESAYPPFAERSIPEVNDLNVLVEWRRRGIGSELVRAVEGIAREEGHPVVGIGVGMTTGYDSARRLYPKLGYVPDGRGPRPSAHGDTEYLTKSLRRTPRPMWRCPKCERAFANRNQTHSCGPHSLDAHFTGKPPAIRELFDALVAAIRGIGPVEVLPEKTRIAFHVRMSFAQVTPRRQWLDGHLVLARRIVHPRFRKVQTFSPRNHVHVFRLRSPDEIDEQFRTWLAEAYAVGQQKHLERPLS
jgi:GNAT superfamily N-acetyltransferase